VVADRGGNGLVWFGENPVSQLGRLGYARWELLGHTGMLCGPRAGEGREARLG
jgi:hypothetical protein